MATKIFIEVWKLFEIKNGILAGPYHFNKNDFKAISLEDLSDIGYALNHEKDILTFWIKCSEELIVPGKY